MKHLLKTFIELLRELKCDSILGDDLLEFHQAVVSTLRDADEPPIDHLPAPMAPLSNTHHSHSIMPHTSEDMARISDTHTDIGPDHEDETDSGKL